MILSNETIAYTNWGARKENCREGIWLTFFVSRQNARRTYLHHTSTQDDDRKRDRSESPNGDASTEPEMTAAQLKTCRRLVANAAKYQGLSFTPGTTTIILIRFTL